MQKLIYLAFNKPPNCVSALKDNLHKTVMDFLPLKYRNLHIVGRLDKDTTGLLFLTNDGAFTHQMTHPKKHIPKTYEVTLLKEFTLENKSFLEKPFHLDYGKTQIQGGIVKQIEIKKIHLTIKEGKFHQVKKMIFNIDNEVVQLKRIAIGHFLLEKFKISEGEYVEFDPKKINEKS